MEPVILILIFLAGICLLAVFWAIGNYNTLIRLRNHVRESWAGIDTELKRRHELIPNLVETVKGYARHEKQVFESVIEARNIATAPHDSPATQAADENHLLRALGGMFALAEGYPELKSDRNFLQLQEELVNTEDRIQAARRFYNANVRDLNNRIEMFPSSVIANSMNLKRADFFEVESIERAVPRITIR